MTRAQISTPDAEPCRYRGVEPIAAAAASLATLIGPNLNDGASGTHLIALPHSGFYTSVPINPYGTSTNETAA